jgi:hypothetical protein
MMPPRSVDSGPLETDQWPHQLRARVVSPGEPARVHGYEIEGDIARHYGWSDYQLLCLTGELPAPERARAFEIASLFLAPQSVAHAPSHAAVLSRLCGARDSGTIGVAAIGLAEQARVLIAAHRDLLQWLAEPRGPLPAAYRTPTVDSSVARLAEALAEIPFEVPVLCQQPTRDAALIGTLWAAGVTRRVKLESAIVHARLPAALAEAFAERATNFGQYPVDLPHFEYQDPIDPASVGTEHG